jgi:hypothetical protein
MVSITRTVVREPATSTPDEYARRVYRLAATYAALFALAVVGLVLLVWQAQLYVTLTQRSNVETLTLAFFFVLFGYLAALSAPGAASAARIGYYALLARLSGQPDDVERRKMEALGPPGNDPPVVALNLALELEGSPGQPFEIPIVDEIGSLGSLRIDGARVTHVESRRDGSNDLFAYFVHQLNAVCRLEPPERPANIVQWNKLDDEATEEYLAHVQFARNLEKQMGGVELWPRVTLSRADCEDIQQRLSAICRPLRDEAFLPDWEYSGEHKLPIIPEPLGLVSLSRTERRVDPSASMGCAVLVVAAAVVVLALIVAFPPWVPGS